MLRRLFEGEAIGPLGDDVRQLTTSLMALSRLLTEG